MISSLCRSLKEITLNLNPRLLNAGGNGRTRGGAFSANRKKARFTCLPASNFLRH
jgi:hypothetical protein